MRCIVRTYYRIVDSFLVSAFSYSHHHNRRPAQYSHAYAPEPPKVVFAFTLFQVPPHSPRVGTAPTVVS